jgi:hypothetical protein
LNKFTYCDGIWSFARQRLCTHRLKAGIVEPNMELSVFLCNNSSTFPRQRTHEEQ